MLFIYILIKTFNKYMILIFIYLKYKIKKNCNNRKFL